MPTQPCYLIYLAYGSPSIYAEAVYSLLTYYRVAVSPVQVLIYTDSPGYFQQLFGHQAAIMYPVVAPAEWQSWRGVSNRVYMLKIGVLAHAARYYPGNLLFVDTDTIWQLDPQPLFRQIEQGQRFMYASEGYLATASILSRKVYQALRGQKFEVGGRSLTVSPETIMYNSGVLGFAQEAARQLPQIWDLADQLFLACDKHVMEQLAFSMCFALNGPIEEAEPYLLHYWNIKEIRPFLVQAVAQGAGRSLAELGSRLAALQVEKHHRAEMAYRQLPGWRRALRKVLGRQWHLPHLP